MKKLTRVFIVQLLFISALATAQSQNLKSLEDKAHEYAILQDEKGFDELKKKLDNIKEGDLSKEEKAHLYYLKAFVGYQPVFINYGQVENTMDVISVVKRNLEKAIELDPKHVEARSLKALLTSGNLPPGKALDAIKEDLDAIRKLKNGDIYAALVTGYAKAFTSDGGVTDFEKAIKAFEKNGRTDDWWYLSAKVYLADIYLGNFKREEDYAKGNKLVEEIKTMYPKSGYLQVVNHFISDQSSKKLSKEPKISWSELATDAGDDARDPQKMLQLDKGGHDIFDAKQLDYALDFSNGIVWFKFQYEKFPSENFGINIFFDLDGDDENGNLFMFNREFRYDIAGTLWLRKDGDKYMGVNGLATGHDFARRRMVAKKEGAFEYYIDKENKVLIVGVAHQYLGYPQDIKVYAAVGTNKYWEDNIPNKGGVSITP